MDASDPSSIEYVVEIEGFLAREAELADEHRYDEWLALWERDGQYFVPTSASLDDPLAPAIIRDDFGSLKERIDRLKTGLVHSQTPPSEVSRVLGRITLEDVEGGTGSASVTCHAPFVILESRPRGMEYWGGRYRYSLRRRQDGGWGIVEKRAVLVNRDTYLPPLTFLL